MSRLVTTLLKNAMTGGAKAAGATTVGATAAAANVLLAAVLLNVCAVDTATDSATVATGCVAVETTSTTSAGAVDDDVVFTTADWVEFDLLPTGVVVVCSASSAGVAGGVSCRTGSVGATGVTGPAGNTSAPSAISCVSDALGDGSVEACDSAVLVCAPPLLLTVTPGATWVLDDVLPELRGGLVGVMADGDPIMSRPIRRRPSSRRTEWTRRGRMSAQTRWTCQRRTP